MKLLIEIPPEFEGHYCHDGFDDSLERLKQDAHLLAGNYEKELVDMLIDAFQKAQIYIDLSPQWIPVTERLPQDGERALVMRYDYVTSTPFYDLLWFDNGEWWNRHFAGDYAVTHWMHLPEPPKEADNG